MDYRIKIFICTILAQLLLMNIADARVNRRGTTSTRSQNANHGITSTRTNSQGQIATRSSSNSKMTGHQASSTGYRGNTATSSWTGKGTGTHTVTNTTTDQSKTVTNQQVASHAAQKDASTSKKGSSRTGRFAQFKNKKFGKTGQETSGGSSSDELSGEKSMSKSKLAFGKKEGKRDESAEAATAVGLESMNQQAQQNEQNDSSDSSTGSDTQTQKDQDALFNSLAAQLQGTQQVSSNASPKNPSQSAAANAQNNAAQQQSQGQSTTVSSDQSSQQSSGTQQSTAS